VALPGVLGSVQIATAISARDDSPVEAACRRQRFRGSGKDVRSGPAGAHDEAARQAAMSGCVSKRASIAQPYFNGL
jgi:hypothetical protein